MQPLAFLLLLGLFFHRALPADRQAALAERAPTFTAAGNAGLALSLCAVGLLAAGLYALLSRHTQRRLDRPRLAWRLRRLHRFQQLYQGVVVGLFFYWLAAGGLGAMNAALPESLHLATPLASLLPPLLLLAWPWACDWPITVRLQEASLIRKADQGQPLSPTLSRPAWMVLQMRLQWGLLLPPAMLLLLWMDLVQWLTTVSPASTPPAPLLPANWQWPLQLLGGLSLWALIPPWLCWLWRTRPLPAGALRSELEAITQQHGLTVRHLLLWPTHGTVVNAAVLGPVPGLRYVLLSDALLERLPPRHIQAVMAHELGHLHHHHLFWMLAITLTPPLVGQVLLSALPPSAGWHPHFWPWGFQALGLGLAGLGWLLYFGWVSRRFEQQADAFAAGHLSYFQPGSTAQAKSAESATSDEQATDLFTPEGVHGMIGALHRVALLSGLPLTHPSFRHGSIHRRCENLRAIIGRKRTRPLPVDRTLRRLRLATCLLLGLSGALFLMPATHQATLLESPPPPNSNLQRQIGPATSD